MFVLLSGCVLTDFNLYFDQHCILSYYYCILFSVFLSLFQEYLYTQLKRFDHHKIKLFIIFYISIFCIIVYNIIFMFFIYIIWWYFLLSCQSFEADSLSSFLLFFFSVISTSYNQSSCFVIRRISVYGTEAHTLRV